MRAAINRALYTLREKETASGRNGIFVLERMVISLIKIIIMDKNIMRAWLVVRSLSLSPSISPSLSHTHSLIAFDSIGISIVCYLGCRC